MTFNPFQLFANVQSIGRALRLGRCMFIWLFLSGVSGIVNAGQWQLEKIGDQYRISVKSAQGDRLILNHEDEDTRFVINVRRPQLRLDEGHKVQIWFDNDTSIFETGLTPIKGNAFQIKLTKKQKSSFIDQMINRVDIHIRYLLDKQNYHEMNFSLLGFTAVLNDFLIAHEIGHLDPEWLNENQKNRELMCYYAANFSVLAMLYRKQGMSQRQSVNKLKSQYTEALSEIITNIAAQIYKMDAAKLPRDPRGDKFGIFQRCMESFNN